MKKINLNSLFEKILIIFLVIQPIFDFKIFYNSISTLIRVIIIFILFTYYFFTSKNKYKYLLLIYPCLLGIYFVFHHINALNFNSLVPGNFNYSIVKEALYFVKMLCPLLLIYVLFKANLKEKSYINIMKAIVLAISLIIIFGNIFGFSYGSYSDKTITANIFEWFNKDYTYLDLASKGLFEYGNQISAVLIMFLPFMIFTAFKSDNPKELIFNLFVLICNVFALILLCTKVAVLGILVVYIYATFTFIFIAIINKNKLNFKKYIPIATVLIVYVLLLPINPMFNRLNERENVIQTFSESVENTDNTTISENTISAEDIEITNQIPENDIIEHNTTENVDLAISEAEMMSYIENNHEAKKVHKQFVYENYPYQYDPEFWYNFLQEDISLTTDYRYIETSMIRRVIEINNNPMDKWFGITNTRLQNVFNIEKDFVVQYYALGIIGFILIFAPYFIMLLVFAYKVLYSKFKYLNILNLLAGITIVFLFGISYFSGNLLNSLSFTIYFSMLFVLLRK